MWIRLNKIKHICGEHRTQSMADLTRAFLCQVAMALDLIVQFSVTTTQSLIQQILAELVFLAGSSFWQGIQWGQRQPGSLFSLSLSFSDTFS